MALNGKILTVEEREDLWASGWDLLPKEHASKTLLLFLDRQASLDSLHHFLNGPRKAPVKEKIKSIVAKEIRCDPELLKQTMRECPAAVSLVLEKNEIRAEGLAVLLDVLQAKAALEVLSLKRNFIGNQGATSLGETFTKWKCRKLHTLCLSFCNISGKGIEGLCKGISRMPTVLSLTSLDLSANFCKVDGCKMLAPFIVDSRKLQFLNLGNNCIEDEGAKALIEAVSQSDVLQTLNIEGNHITNAGVRFVCDALKKNCGLTDLGLHNNEIDQNGAMYLSQAIRVNTVLTALNLSHNNIGDSGAEHVAGVIRMSIKLLDLRLVSNSIGDKGGKFIELAYQRNKTLKLLDLDMNKINDEQHQALAIAMRTRGNIGILRICCHAYGDLRPDNKLLEMAKAQIELEAAEEAAEAERLKTPEKSEIRTPRQKSKPSLDTGNVKLVVKKKEEAPKPTGPLGVLFKKWSGAGEGQKNSKLAKSVDFKEFTEMLKALKLMPGKIGRHKAQEIFRQANRRADDPTPDGDTSEMDWDEFEFATKKVCEFCQVDVGSLVTDSSDVDANVPKKTGKKEVPVLKGLQAAVAELAPDASLKQIFETFAAGDGQSKKRAASMDSKEFLPLLEFLDLLPAKINKTQAMDMYAKGKAKSGGDQSEMDWNGFEFAMKKIADLADVSFGLIHTYRVEAKPKTGAKTSIPPKTSPRAVPRPKAFDELPKDATSSDIKMQQASRKINQAMVFKEKLASPRRPADEPPNSSSNPKLQQTTKKISNALKMASPRRSDDTAKPAAGDSSLLSLSQ